MRPAVQDDFNEEVQRRLRGTVWNAGGCRSYYLDRNGRNSTIFPGSTMELRRRLRFAPRDYVMLTRPQVALRVVARDHRVDEPSPPRSATMRA